MFILENKETGETIELSKNSGQLPSGWRVKAYIPERHYEHEAKLAVWAAKHNLPIVKFLETARWLLKKDCPYCQLSTQILRRLSELGEAQAEEAIARILDAKNRNDREELERIRKSLCPSESPELPQQS